MATALKVQDVLNQKSLVLSLAAADVKDGNEYFNNGKTTLVLQNTSAAAQTVVFTGNEDPTYGCKASHTVTLEAGETAVIGQLAQAAWNQGNTVQLLASDEGVQLAAYKHAL